jgi:hypothetical protein
VRQLQPRAVELLAPERLHHPPQRGVAQLTAVRGAPGQFDVSVDVSSAPCTATQTQLGVADLRAQSLERKPVSLVLLKVSRTAEAAKLVVKK